MSYIYLLERGEESSGACFSDIPASVLSRSRNTPDKCCCSDSATTSCHDSPSGTTSQPSMDGRGAAVSTWWRVDFLAKIYRQQEQAQGLTERDLDSGKKWPASLAKYDRDSRSWKTHQLLLLGGWESFSETWPKWGIMHDGESWGLSMSGHLTNARGSGYSPRFLTPRCMEVDESPENFRKRMNSKRVNDRKNGFGSLSMQVKAEQEMWPKPCATNHKGSGKAGQLRDRLDYAVERGATKSKTYWPTPTKSDGMGGPGCSGRAGGMNLRTAVAWPTPRTKGMCGGTGAWEQLKKATDSQEEARKMGAGNGGQLNPTWVEWLMGWPLEWTDLRPLGTDKFRRWRRSHGDCSEGR